METGESMLCEQSEPKGQPERVRVVWDSGRLKILTERYEECLGWYTAGSLVLRVAQLALLQQALKEAARHNRPEGKSFRGKVIPFPLLHD